MDAMSDAIEGAAVMLYAVSLQYKESANVGAVVQDTDDCRSGCRYVLTRLPDCVFCSVSIGGQLRPSARAGHDPADDAKRLQAKGLA